MGTLWVWALALTAILLSFGHVYTEITQTFIVRVRNDLKPSQFLDVEEWYSTTLRSLTSYKSMTLKSESGKGEKQRDFVHVYKTVFNGFAARLTNQQVEELSNLPQVLGVLPDRVRQIQTTRSPEFLGLAANSLTGLLAESDYGSNVIIGVFDTGICPERRSFNDVGLGPVPPHWKGDCVDGEKFMKKSCNKKVIGARFFTDGYEASVGAAMNSSIEIKSPRDTDGHGTHTASTAAGRQVANASLFGYAEGVAVGIAPKARIAVYKMCWERGCLDSDILAAFDKATEDGVDVISLSVGGSTGLPYEMDPISIGSFGAMARGIFVSASAGNGGPETFSVANVAPWVTTVGASTIDRKFPADLLLADGTVITGVSLYSGKPLLKKTYLPLIYAGNASSGNQIIGFPFGATTCLPGSLDKKLVRGKIVVCDRGGSPRAAKGLAVKEAGGVGVIVENVDGEGEGLSADPHLIPGLAITESGGNKLRTYIKSSKNPRATMVFRGTQVGVRPAPVLATFSSRGPSFVSFYVLKPDLIAPGVDILAAWPDTVAPSELSSDPRRSEFNILSGTSMSCPHVSGLAALLKGAHRDWSPAMIRSALMTTAYIHDLSGNPVLDATDYNVSNVWDMGAGHVDPQKAVDPGLVYDLTVNDYLDFLCASNYTEEDINRITHKSVSCKGKPHKPWDINYPAISVAFDMSSRPSKYNIAVTRTATHVGNGSSSYSVVVTPPRGAKVTVDPPKMTFTEKGQKKSYVVRIQMQSVPPGKLYTESGKLTWTDGKHHVTSPLVVVWKYIPT
ncbi:subtilisin-like protease SBT1.5 [Actinidia eriantha]|uniref:subtilisin-like protease SBT1.5 n=1 Tax=Actinidia eriantha TaxID=165200 RepID=UPI00258831CA|nr:subtilisin-like protease SBT1.5 [Actinidia eriantha]